MQKTLSVNNPDCVQHERSQQTHFFPQPGEISKTSEKLKKKKKKERKRKPQKGTKSQKKKEDSEIKKWMNPWYW